MARDDRDRVERRSQGRCEALFVSGVPEREQQRDRHGPGIKRPYGGDHALHLCVHQRYERAAGPHALGHSHDVCARDERRRVIAREVVQRRPILPPQPEQVLEPGGRD